MKFFDIQIPVHVVAEGAGHHHVEDISKCRTLVVRVGPLHSQATPEDAMKLLSEKLERHLETIDIGDCE